ncbi:PQQ-binding-like beta-propeller repeat protein [Actinomadura sp. HBU206391]|uniref:outer membrane protein assembly factor BamB family protein n=1 Tax=Actinomadura sp. HBU206391 TaxID=2731692 RepID=UPI00164FEAE8|nr:PQQ-binding-like beta-propeller repeat protein [Actinomadura sp. HBU206391]MBC6458095.1 PQQ-binding-like beta-propeller repeat protein [Actinomadura sp. HBU206391]
MSTGESGRLSRRRAIAGLAGAAIAGSATVWPLREEQDAYPSIPAPDGPLLWTAEVKLAADEFFGPVTAGHLLLVERPFAARGRERWTVLSCLDTGTGRRLWSVSLGPSTARLQKVVVAGSVVLARTYEALHAFDLHTGRLLWRRERNTGGSASLTVTVGGGLVHDSGDEENAVSTTTSRHALHAYEVGSGRLRWTTVVQPRVVTADAPIYAAGSLLGTAVMSGVSRNSETFAYAVDATTGEQRWSRRLGVWDSGPGSGVAHAAGTFYVFSRGRGVLHAVDVSTGRIRWQVRPRPRSGGGAGLSVGERTLDAGVPVVAGTTVYVCDEHGVLHAFDVRDGRRRWAFGTDARPSKVHMVPEPRTGDGQVYFRASHTGRSNSTLYALGADERRPRWQRRADGSYSGPLVSGNMLHVSDGDAITGYDPIDGSVRRRVDLRALGAAGTTELVTDGANVYALSGVQVLALRLES